LCAEVHERLTAGATVADIGCGMGVALQVLAEAYPSSTFHGYDVSKHALSEAENIVGHLTNVILRNPEVPGEQLPEKAYDFLFTMDAIHDMTRPDKVLAMARKALKDDAAGYVIADFKSTGSLAGNIRHMAPLAVLGYGVSVALCMSNGLSEEGGMGLGTLGWHPKLAEEMLKDAGFVAVDILEWGHELNNFYHAKM
jgi:SAM-dependent methyltransferase